MVNNMKWYTIWDGSVDIQYEVTYNMKWHTIGDIYKYTNVQSRVVQSIREKIKCLQNVAPQGCPFSFYHKMNAYKKLGYLDNI